MKREPNPTCAAMLAHISAYLDREIDAAECAAIERHCRGCARCASLVSGLKRTLGLCRRAGRAALPTAVRARARRSVERLLAAQAQPRRLGARARRRA